MRIQYVDHMGSDLTVVNSARVSFGKTVAAMEEKDEKLVRYLAKHNHWTPFAHPQISLRVKIPVFLARQYFKHIVGSVKNEVSRRYVNDAPSYHFPEWRFKPDGSIKQGSGMVGEPTDQELFNGLYEKAIDYCDYVYTELIQLGVAPEQARMVLPQSMYTEFVDTGSLVYWARMYKQRSDSHSQSEWWPLMEELDMLMSDLFPIAWKELT